MEWMSVLVSLASLVIGWLLNEIAKRFQMSRERRAHIGRALSNLLELHHQIRSIENTIKHVMQHLDIPKEGEIILRSVFEQIFPQGTEYVARYEEAIEQLSESDPIAAFELRTKAQIPRFLGSLRTVAISHGTQGEEISLVEIENVEKQLKEMLIPELGRAILELAKLHGRSTQRQVNNILNSNFELPTEALSFLETIRTEHNLQLARQNEDKPN